MGRRKIEIQPITHDRNRSVTFLKRKNGLFKKAYELGVLCSVDVCVIVFAHNGKLHEYCSGDSTAIIEKRLKYSGDRDLRRPSDFKGAKGGAGAAGDKDSEAEDEGDSGAEEPVVAPVNGAKRKANGDKTNDRPDSFASSSRDQSNSFSSSTSEHPTSLPPSTHPLSIGGLSSSFGSATPTPTNASTLAQHHQQLAQQFLVTQLQNINPNLNSQPIPPAGPAFPFGLGSVPPRGSGMMLPFAGLGIAGNSTGGPPSGPAVLPPGASAYSNAFLSSLLGNAAAAVAQQQANQAMQDMASSQTPPFSGLEWPGANPGRPSNSTPPVNPSSASSSASIPPTSSPQVRQQAHPLAAPSGVENNWLDLLLGGGGGGGAHANVDVGPPKTTPSSNLFPVWSNNARPQAGAPQAGSPGRSETPIDGVPMSETLLAIAGSGLPRPSSRSGNKRSRERSSPSSNATPRLHSDDSRMALDDHDRPPSTSGSRRSPAQAQLDDDDDGGRSESGGSDGKRRRTQ
ncbi:hypothetical protein M407DRAFT_240766 [Tulasnella calospora MUT 4182]|uniref:MADS-box domain-containing protein n=1 Tax=Tulasnella calospora MUT 4182 TaxID=1051891 RepID=A0A0C3QWG1_9AGAM|nr:hypothetical protein M407DRAFT_240766 [Tulasnella calospora MUT 4182]